MEDRFGLGHSISAPPKALSGLFFGVKEDPRTGRPIEVTHITMGATTLTKEEIEQYEKQRKFKVEKDFRQALFQGLFDPGRSYDRSKAEQDAMLKRLAPTVEKLRKEGKLKGLSAQQITDYSYKVALERYSIGTMKESFDDAKEWTVNFLSSLKKGAFDTDKATDELWKRVGVIGYDVPFIGKLTVADIRTFDWAGSLQIDNLIKEIKNIDYGKIAEGLVSSIAPEGGWADKGMEAFTEGCSMITGACSLAASSGLASVASGLGAVSSFLAAAAPWVAVAMLLIAIGEMIYGSWAEDKTAASEAYKATGKIFRQIHDAVGASSGTSANEGTVNLRIIEMAAYATTARKKTGKSDLKMLWGNNVDPREWGGVNGCWADGSQRTRFGGNHHFGRPRPSHFKNRKRMAVCLRDFASGVLSYLKQFNTGNLSVDMSDRRIAFESMCVSIIPNATKYYVGLWTPEKPQPDSAFKVSAVSPVEQQKALKELVKNQPIWIKDKRTRTAISLFNTVIVRDANKDILPSSTLNHVGTFYGEGNTQHEADAAAWGALARSAKRLPANYGFTLWARKGFNFAGIYEVEGEAYGGANLPNFAYGGGPSDPLLLGGAFAKDRLGNEEKGLIVYSRDGGYYKVLVPNNDLSFAVPKDSKPKPIDIIVNNKPTDGPLTKLMRPYAQTIVNFVNKRAEDPKNITISTDTRPVNQSTMSPDQKAAHKAKIDSIAAALLKAKTEGDAKKAQLRADPAAMAQLAARKAEILKAQRKAQPQNKAAAGIIALAAAAAGVYLMTKS